MLVENKVLPLGQVAHPVVSKAISNLWQELLRDGETNIYQKRFSETRTAAPCPFTYPSCTGCTDGGRRSSEADSLEASSSFRSSTPEDVLIEDAFELAAGFLDCNSNRKLSNLGSPVQKSSPWASAEIEKLLHQNVSDFLRAKFFSCAQKEVLQQTKHYTLQLENAFGFPLKRKGHTLLDDSAPCSLEDIEVESLTFFSRNQCYQIDHRLYLHPVIWRDIEESVEELRIEQANKSLDSLGLMEFERYMTFYQQTMDMLIEYRVVPPRHVTHPVVSKAIYNLWQELLRNGKANICAKYLSEARNPADCPVTYPSGTGCTTVDKRGSEVEIKKRAGGLLSSEDKGVLQQTNHYTLQPDNTLGSLLKRKGHILEDSDPCSLEDIEVESLLYFRRNRSGPPAAPMSPDQIDHVPLHRFPIIKKDLEESVEELRIEQANKSSWGLMEFERYMSFYKQTMDMLIENKVVPPGHVTHPVVSKAISNLWQELLRNRKTNIYQKRFSETRNPAACPFTYPPGVRCINGGKRVRAAESQKASSSFLFSTPEDVSVDDGFELAASILECNTSRILTGSPTQKSSPWVNAEIEKLLHQNVSDFLRAKFFSCAQRDYDAEFLSCTETFDDDGYL